MILNRHIKLHSCIPEPLDNTMNPPPNPPTSHITKCPKFDRPIQKQNGEITTRPMQHEISSDSIPGSPGQQESCKKDGQLKIPQAIASYNTPPEAVGQRSRQGRIKNVSNNYLRVLWSVLLGYHDESSETDHEEEEPQVYRCNKTKFTASRSSIEKPSDRLVFSQDQHHEIQPVSSSTPHDSISPHQAKLTHISLKLDSSSLSYNTPSSCASCSGDPDSQLHDTNGVTSCFINILPIYSPSRSSPIIILAEQAKTHEQPETGFITPAPDRPQNPNNNSAQDILLKTKCSANVKPRSSLRKSFDPSRPKKRIRFQTPIIDDSAPPGKFPKEVYHEQCKKRAKIAEPELKPKKCRPLSERLAKLELAPEMKPDPAYAPIARVIAADSVWVNVTQNRRHPPKLELDVQAIKKIKKQLKKPFK